MSRISGVAIPLGCFLLINAMSVNSLVEQGMYQSSNNQQNLDTNSATGATGSFPFLMPMVSPKTVSECGFLYP